MSIDQNQDHAPAPGFEGKLDQVLARRDALSRQLEASADLNPDELAKLSKEFSDISGVVAHIEEWKNARDEMESWLVSEDHTDDPT